MGRIYAIVHKKHEDEKRLRNIGNKNYRHEAEVNMKNNLAKLNREYTLKEVPKEDDRVNELVDDVFKFLKDSESSTSKDIKESEDFMVSINRKKL